MKLASIEEIADIRPHENAEKLELATVLGYTCIVLKDQFKIGDKIVLIQPDTILPDAPWSELFKSKSNRVKAIKLRGVFSFGIVMSLDVIGVDGEIGEEVSEKIGVIKYEPPAPTDLSAKGNLPTGLCRTDEERWQNMVKKLPYGQIVDVTLKIDGQSATYFCKHTLDRDEDGNDIWEVGVCSRSLTIKPDTENNYTRIEKKYKILEKLKHYCKYHNVSLALRGEIYGTGIQSHGNNPHSKLPLDFAAFSVFNMDTLQYEEKGSEHHYEKVCSAFLMEIPTVPVIERDVILSEDIIKKYSSEINKVDDKPFEGVVVKHSKGSFKIINLSYDERK